MLLSYSPAIARPMLASPSRAAPSRQQACLMSAQPVANQLCLATDFSSSASACMRAPVVGMAKLRLPSKAVVAEHGPKPRYVAPILHAIRLRLVAACRFGQGLRQQWQDNTMLLTMLQHLEAGWQQHCCYEIVGAVACQETYQPLLGAKVKVVVWLPAKRGMQQVVLGKTRTKANGTFSRLFVDKEWLHCYPIAIEIDANAYYRKTHLLRPTQLDGKQITLFTTLEEIWL